MLNGQLALVTGAGQGIGAAIARELCEQGSKVILADINGESVQASATALRVEGFEAWGEILNVANRTEVIAFSDYVLRAYGSISILINNAGVGGSARLGDPGSATTWDRLISVNLTGVFDVTSAFLPALKETRGCIINIASVVAFTSGFAHAGYTASKGGVRSLTQVMCRELAGFGIRVNAVAPGYIDTPMQKEDPVSDDWLRWHCPMGRLGEPMEVARPVAFLASPAASFVNGVTLPVDGGYLII